MSKQIMYIHKDGKSETRCPYGESIDFKTNEKCAGAFVGSFACGDCLYNKGTYHNYVVCKRKEATP